MQQQTAVEWLIEQIKSDQNQKAKSASEWMEIFEQAKQMEANQSDLDYNQGYSNGWSEGYDKGMSDYNRF